jgi:ATP-dependent DNA helicase HFM1/MER3
MSNLRFLAVSATMPNLTEVASVIEANEAFAFNDSFRPVPLTVHVQACGHIGKNQYFFDKSLNQHVPSLLHRYSKGRPAIVFCHSKKDTEVLAHDLTKSSSSPSSLNISVLNNFANRANTASLQRFLRCGVAYHHAGLEPSDRKVVEEAFMSGSINCLCATSTLAMGVNLPSHLVIVKGSKFGGFLFDFQFLS